MTALKQRKISASDHRVLNQELEIFLSDNEVGQGLPILLKKGTIIRNLIQQFIRQKEQEMGAEEVVSPVLAHPAVYQRSGHLDHYSEYIFPPITKQEELFQLRPMTCPHHCIIYRRKVHSYRELPIWICEHSILHRFESSGSLKGLERARWMELSDNHLFCTEEQIEEVFQKCFYFICSVFEKFGIKVDRFVCSFHDSEKRNKYHSDNFLWQYAEDSLLKALEKTGVEFIKLVGEAAFYGPKLDIEVETSDGKKITFATIQLDFVLPKKFNLSYINQKGVSQTPVIIHYSAIGSYQRFISILLEQKEGRLPFWLAPCQLVILPLFSSEEKTAVSSYCDQLSELVRGSVRFEVWKDKHLASRINKIHRLKIPAYIVIGRAEVRNDFFVLEVWYEQLSFSLTRNELVAKFSELNNTVTNKSSY